MTRSEFNEVFATFNNLLNFFSINGLADYEEDRAEILYWLHVGIFKNIVDDIRDVGKYSFDPLERQFGLTRLMQRLKYRRNGERKAHIDFLIQLWSENYG